MAHPTNTYDTYDTIGMREDLSDLIYMISPTDTPFMSNAGRGKASATAPEWQKDELGTAGENAQAEGDDAAGDLMVKTVKLTNNCMISRKVVVISGTLETVDKAGRKSELAYQLAKSAKELKRDMEYGLTQDTARSATDTRKLAGLENWMVTNTSFFGAGAICPQTLEVPNDAGAITEGTPRAITEALVKTNLQLVWNQGGEPTIIMCGGVNKQRVSSFTGNSTRMDVGEDKTLTAAIDIYKSDFGTHRVVPNRFQKSRSLFNLDMSLWEVLYLRPFKQTPLAKTGDAETRMLITEYTLCSKNQKGSGAVFDLTV